MVNRDAVRWTLKKPVKVAVERHFSPNAELKVCSRSSAMVTKMIFGGAGYFIESGLLGIQWGQSAIGAVGLYFLELPDGVFISTTLADMYFECKKQRLPKSRVQLCEAGVVYTFSAKDKKVMSFDTVPVKYTETKDITLGQAADEFLDLLVESAKHYVGKKVVTTISGGTDGILTALALKLAGVEQYCVCLGTSEDCFDPTFAKSYAEQLGLNYKFIKIPTDNAELEPIVIDTVKRIEMTEYSNVLMGVCNNIVGEYAKEVGADIVLCADMADVVLGNDLQSAGRFKKTYKDEDQTAENWAKFRIKTQLKVMPNNIQIFKGFFSKGIYPHQLWYDLRVVDYLLTMPLNVTPISRKKILYYTILEKYLTDVSWADNGKKIGYYTGTGIGKVRLEGGVLSDASLRSIYKQLFG